MTTIELMEVREDMSKVELVKYNLTYAMKAEVNFKKSLKDLKDDSPQKTLVEATLETSQEVKRAMRTIISMYPELNKKKSEINDEDVEYLCKKIIKNEKLRLIYQNKFLVANDVEGKSPKDVSKIENEKLIEFDEHLTSTFIIALENFLPQMVTEKEIHDFIKENIDFSKLKNKMQAIGIIKKHFGNTVDANLVKDIIQKI